MAASICIEITPVPTDPHHVLLVESGGQPRALEELLAQEGWHITRTEAIADAMDRAKRDRPSALVFRGTSDDSLTLARKLRANARTALLPMIVIADARNGAREELARWGVTSVLAPDASDRLVADSVRQVSPVPHPAQAPDTELGRADRLNALERARLLDSPPEEPFDRLARVTGQLLDVPIVLMSVVDRQRQFFKAQVGLPEPFCDTRETPITHSFCQWVVSADEALVVDDARRDLLLSESAATKQMGVVAYAGVPIRVMPDNETIGSFCAVDMKPHAWDARELRALDDAATIVQALTAMRQVDWLPPLTSDEFRDLAGVAGRAIEAVMRLSESGKTRVEPAEQQALLAIASGLGRDLARLADRGRARRHGLSSSGDLYE